MTVFTLTVPASAANIGPGFDSMGIALKRYLILHVRKSAHFEFIHDSSFLPTYIHYTDHFIYKVANQIATKYNKPLSPCQVVIKSNIPLARGLGSSASAILAGIELANQLCNLSLTARKKLNEATNIEGHPDNVTPTLFGGCVISTKSSAEHLDFIQIPQLNFESILYIPDLEVNTEDARKALPSYMSHKEAVYASSVSNLMVAALLKGNYSLAGQMMEKDLFHEPYRAKLIPHYDNIKSEAKRCGAYSTVISGAGPTMISFVPTGKGKSIAQHMKSIFPHYTVEAVNIDEKGLQIKY